MKYLKKRFMNFAFNHLVVWAVIVLFLVGLIIVVGKLYMKFIKFYTSKSKESKVLDFEKRDTPNQDDAEEKV